MTDRLFAVLLRLLPTAFRREFGAEMHAVFAEEVREGRRQGWKVVMRLVASNVLGILALARREHLAIWRQDVGGALRLLRRSPGFALVAIGSLAVGIGGTTAVYGVGRSLFVNPLPIADADRAVIIGVVDRRNPGVTPLSTDNFLDVRRRASTVVGVSVAAGLPVVARLGETPENLIGNVVSGHYFGMLGLTPAIGRLIEPADDVSPAGNPVVVLSHRIWRRAFATDPSVVGRTVQLNQQSFTVVGVLPEGFEGTMGVAVDLFVPLATHDVVRPGTPFSRGRQWRWLNTMGRLAPGVSIEQARAELAQVGDQLAAEFPAFNRDRTLTVVPLARAVVGDAQYDSWQRMAWMLAGVVGTLLLIACSNVANLLLARNGARAREMAVRQALGAGRGRLFHQLLTESVVLAAAGGLAGLALAEGLYRWLWAVRPDALEFFPIEPRLTWAAVVFAGGLSAGAAILFGVWPAWRASRPDLAGTLAPGSRTPDHAERATLRAALVAAQVALAVIALAASGLFVRSLQRAAAIDPGFAADRTWAAGYTIAGTRSADETLVRHLDLLARVRAMPSVAAAAIGDRLPLQNGTANTIDVPGPDGTVSHAGVLIGVADVLPGYFEALGLSLLAGRDVALSDGSGAPPVAVVNRTMAERFWPGQAAVGQRFFNRVGNQSVEVVGVVSDTKYVTLGEPAQPFFYRPLSQRGGLGAATAGLVIRPSADPRLAIGPVVELIQAVNTGAPPPDVVPLSDRLRGALWAPRMLAMVLSVFGVIAVTLAAAGLYGLLALVVGQRRHEFGLRMAMGAQPSDVVSIVLRNAGRWVGVGLATGLAGAALMSRAADGLVYEFTGVDMVALAGSAALLAVVATVACIVPARRAARIDPLDAMRG